ncbi:MAG: hypothetical protein ACI30A_02310 [Paludibacteraceae bacterium]
MAKAELEIPFSSIRGRISHDSATYVTTRYGQTVISNYPKHRDPKKITPRQRELNTAFAQAVAQTKAELADPVRRAYWQDLFDRHKKSTANKANTGPTAAPSHPTGRPSQPTYKTLRGFTLAHLTKQQTTELAGGDNASQDENN